MPKTKAGTCFCVTTLLLIGLELGFPANLAAAQGAPETGGLTIKIIDGDEPIFNVRQRVTREAIVQVEDENHKPVAGAFVMFAAPGNGPSATFANGTTSITLTTDAKGQATLRGITSNRVQGKFQIRISASKDGKTGSASLNVSNVVPPAAAGSSSSSAGGISGKTIGILAAIGGAAAVGAVVALGRGNSSSPSPGAPPAASPGVVLVQGSPTVGPPR